VLAASLEFCATDFSASWGLAWDEYLFEHGPQNSGTAKPILVGGDGTEYVLALGLEDRRETWIIRSVPFIPQAWTLRSGSATFGEVLQDLVRLRFDLDTSQADADQECALDNIRFLNGPPRSWSFDDGTLQQWALRDTLTGSLVNPGSGGNPDGQAVASQTAGGDLTVLSPLACAVGLENFWGLVWDEFLYDHGGANTVPTRATLTAADGTEFVMKHSEQETRNSWVRRYLPFKSAKWLRVAGTSSFDFALRNATSFGFQMDTSSDVGGPESATDNISVAPAPPLAYCHDELWEPGEFCGRDAYATTGATEMNHDCRVDLLDLTLFAQQYGQSHADLSADFDVSGSVDSLDLQLLAGSYGSVAQPCSSSGMRPDDYHGFIALSLSPDSTHIVDSRPQAPGPGRVYVVVEGWSFARGVEYAVESSSNIRIVRHEAMGYPVFGTPPGVGRCDPDPQHSARAFVREAAPWPGGPINIARIDFTQTDAAPGWIRIVPAGFCAGGTRPRWCEMEGDRSIAFGTLGAVGTNGPAPGEAASCGDRYWPHAEFCGQDAYAATGWPEMNHDCRVDALDYALFKQCTGMPEYYCTSADFTADGFVDLADVGIMYGGIGSTVSACVPSGMQPDSCAGKMALSFGSNPAVIVSTQQQAPGYSTCNVVVQQVSGARVIEYTIETSSNVVIVSHSGSNLEGGCPPEEHRSYRLAAWMHTTAPSTPFLLATVIYQLLDDQAAWLRLRPVAGCPATRTRWAQAACDRSIDFKEISNAGINGPAPAGEPWCVPSDIGDPEAEVRAAVRPQLLQNVPNPFNPSTQIGFVLPRPSAVRLDIFDLAGRQVRRLFAGSLEAGRWLLPWDGRDDAGGRVASGVYVYQLTTEAGTWSRKSVLLK
jgi:hypothetical protein